MKKNLVPFTLLILMTLTIGCSKKNTPSKTELLTAKTWVYDEYFRNYNSSSAVLLYKNGKSNNILDLSKNQVTFSKDGTYSEINEMGILLNGTWKFLNNESAIEVRNVSGTFVSNILMLNSSKFEWLDPISSNGTLGRMIPR
jgi:hypothetical protein